MRLPTRWAFTFFVLLAAWAPAGAAAAATLPTPLLNPPRVAAGEVFSVAGEGCIGAPASFEVTVRGAHGQGFGAGGITAANGAWNVQLRVPVDYPDGTYRVRIRCDVGATSTQYPRVYLTVGAHITPDVTLSATTARAEDEIGVQAVGYGARERVQFSLSSGAQLGSATTNLDGAVSATITIPDGLGAGLVHVVVTGLTSGTRHSAPLHLLASGGCPAQVCDPPAPPLANTGLSTAELLTTAIMLLLGGATLWTAGVRTAG